MRNRPKKNDERFVPGVKAVIPAAGFGTRMIPFTPAVPKEMLPLGRKPLIQWAIEEAIESGICEIGVVIREGKESIEGFVRSMKEGLVEFSPLSPGDFDGVEIRFINQEDPAGLGHAMYEARDFIGDSAFVMIIPDQFMISKVPATLQLLEKAGRCPHAVWSSVVDLPEHEIPFFQGSRSFQLKKKSKDIWEVLAIQTVAGRKTRALRGFGRTYFVPEAIEYFSRDYTNPATGEVDLLLSFKEILKKFQNFAVILEGRPMDLGTWDGYEYYFCEVVKRDRGSQTQ